MFELHDKVALITGAAGGLGDKIARTLHKQGATLALTDMRAEPMEKLKAELGDRVEVFTANLTLKIWFLRLRKSLAALIFWLIMPA